MNNINYKYVIATALLMLGLIISINYVDLPLALYIKHNTPEDIVQFFYYLNKFAEVTLLISITGLMYSYQYLVNKESIKNLAFKLLIHIKLMLLCGLIIQTLKFLIGRYRFSEYLKYNEYGFLPASSIGYANSSLPSGHSAAIFSFMTITMLIFISKDVKNFKLKTLMYSFAAFVASSRLMLNSHYISDVVAGSLLGVLIPYLIVKLYINKTGLKQYLV